jgi:hypothetical protein
LSRRGKKKDPKINGHQPAKSRILFIDGFSITFINLKMKISFSQQPLLPQHHNFTLETSTTLPLNS